MSEELKPCPFCNGEAQRTESSGLVSCAFEECPAFLLAVPADNWNRRAQPAEAEGVAVVGYAVTWIRVGETPEKTVFMSAADFEATGGPRFYSYREPLILQSTHLAALSAVTAERDRLRKDAERYRWLRECDHEKDGGDFGVWTCDYDPLKRYQGAELDEAVDAAMAAKEA